MSSPSTLVCPNPECLADIDCEDPTCPTCEANYPGQKITMECPVCGILMVVTTHISFSAVLAQDEEE